MKAEPVNISLPWGTLEGLHWPRPGAPRVLCLHGWLDNAASFVPLAPCLEEFDLLALDLAGHGLSSHRPQSSRYYFTEYMFDLDTALDVLNWESCHLVGHSMGGGIATLYAAASAERVERLVLLDSLGLLSLPAEQAAQQLQSSMASVRKTRGFLRPYESVEEAMQARQKKSPISDAAARLLCERSLVHTGDYYQWRTDPRLNWRSPQYPGDEQVLNLLAAIRAPTLVMITPTMTGHFGKTMTRKRLAAIPDCTQVSFDGHHHFHMEDPQRAGSLIRDFLLQGDQGQGTHHVDS